MTPPPLTADDFAAFFCEAWGADRDPFPWQKDFARRLCSGQIPDFVAVPTGSGKTACLDAAVFALAVQSSLPVAERTQGRRIFFIVNRRVIVDEAFDRAGELCARLREASPDSIVGRVATALRQISGRVDGEPLTCAQLRGGVYRDRSWAGSLVQPMIVCSTVDQAGSRLLFRGYGVSPQARPIHAALVSQDSLLMIDEAHIARPFIETLTWVEKYRRHEPPGSETVNFPFHFIQMTATPPAGARNDQSVGLAAEDREHRVLKPRLFSPKPAQLVTAPKAKGGAREAQMTLRLMEEAEKLLASDHPSSLAIMVNRVSTARSVQKVMEKKHGERVKLLIGRLRPLDRDATTKEIQERLKTGSASSRSEDRPLIVVSTQCLEVGADLDFDSLVTEAASLDALRQRFGRLNRGGREISARAVIILPGDLDLPVEKLDDQSPSDLIYGNAIPRTWNWLQLIAQEGIVDFGVEAMGEAVNSLRSADTNDETLASMLSPTDRAPTLLPAYLDCWVQTNPTPAADPDIAIFLHGPKREMADVQICWRADLPAKTGEETRPDGDKWSDILSFCPPSNVECLPVPLHVFRQWMDTPGEFEDDSSDVEEIPEAPNAADKKKRPRNNLVDAFVWRGPDESKFAAKSSDIKPGDTVVLRAQAGGWESLGYIPAACPDPQSSSNTLPTDLEVATLDIAEQAAAVSRSRAIFRVHPAILPAPEKGTAAEELVELSRSEDGDWKTGKIKSLLTRLLNDEAPGWNLTELQQEVVRHLAKKDDGLRVNFYPDQAGFVITTRAALSYSVSGATSANSFDIEPDALLESDEPRKLWEHTQDVCEQLDAVLSQIPASKWDEALRVAASLHDWGKADARFQALLRGTTPFTAMASGSLLAKSKSISSSVREYRIARGRAELPEHFRHEMLSVQLAQSSGADSFLPAQTMPRALVLHLIATHHGYGRPFAPVVDDVDPLEVAIERGEQEIKILVSDRIARPSHALDSGIAERFWKLTRHHGWWGLALLESVLRLADQFASANPGSNSGE